VSGFQAGVANAYLADPNVYSGTPGFFSAGAAATANAGAYPIIVSQGTLAASGGYSFAFNSTGSLTVNPKALTITANDATRTYDNVAFSGGNGVTYSGFVNGENSSVLTGTIAYGGNSQGAVNAGTYTIIPSNQTSSNYAINYVNGMLTINRAPITVTANSQTKFIGNPDPPFTYQVTNGTLFGNNSLSGTLARAAGEYLGTYPITQGTLASSNNYDLMFVGSALLIIAPPGIIATSSVMNTTVLPTSPVSLAGTVVPFGDSTVLPYGSDSGAVGGSAAQQTSNTTSADQQTSDTTSENQQRSDASVDRRRRRGRGAAR
jgi:hypothetical protein